jgi:hypothetical protein
MLVQNGQSIRREGGNCLRILCEVDNLATTSKLRPTVLAETASLPPGVTARLLADADVIAGRMARRIASEIGRPGELDEVGDLAYLRSIVSACRDALRVLVRRLHDGRGPRSGDLDRLAQMGSAQADLGVPLDVLLSAYRVAAKVVWEEVVGTVAREHEMPSATLIALASQIFEYLDEISAAVGAAYLERRERLLRRRDQDRDRVLHRLLAGDVSAELRRAAAACELDLAPPYRVIACAGAGDLDRVAEPIWHPVKALTVSVSEGTWVILVDPRVECAELCQATIKSSSEAAFGIGPVAEHLADIADAARRAQRALVVGERLEPQKNLHDEAELGVFAVLDAEPGSVRRFVASVLGPLAAEGVDRRGDLRRTLEAVLSTSGLGEAATRLDLHRHTVVYRLQRIRHLGLDIDDPARRHLLWLALRAQRLLPG